MHLKLIESNEELETAAVPAMSIPATSSTISSAPILTNVGGGGGQGGGCMPQQKDTTMTKIFVGGLPYHTTDESLRMYFAVYGDIEEAVVITDRQTGKSRGYGFVSGTLSFLRFIDLKSR